MGLECGDRECTADFGETCARCNIDCCPTCGNGVLQPSAGERCDTTELNGRTCEYFGYTGGTLSCTSFCDFDFSGCTGPGPICGNGEVEYGEQCDGANLNFQDCTTLGYLEGTLFCSGCRFNPSGCSGIGAISSRISKTTTVIGDYRRKYLANWRAGLRRPRIAAFGHQLRGYQPQRQLRQQHGLDSGLHSNRRY
jgi:hypothetical protein